MLPRSFRYSWRNWRRNPGFTLTAMGVLAVGIGASTAIFTVADGLLLRPLPYGQPDRLLLLSGSTPDQAESGGTLSYPFFTLISERSRSFNSLAACIPDELNLTGHGEPQRLAAGRASWNFLDVLGIHPIAGRTFLPEEDRPGARPVALLSYELATRLFAEPAEAVGQNLTLDSQDYTVIGVLSQRFRFTLIGPQRDLWTARPFDMNGITPARVALGGIYFNLVARLRPGVSLDQARAEVSGLYQQYRGDRPGNYDATLNLTMHADRLQQQLVAGIGPTVRILSAAVGLVLLIACANVASLLLSCALGRRREFALRAALGASRAALVGQLLAESVWLALAAGAAGIALAAVGVPFLTALEPDSQHGAALSIDPRVMAFALALSVLTGLLFGLAPAFQLAGTDLSHALREQGRGATASRQRHRGHRLLVAGQVALSMILLTGAGLLIRSFVRLRTASPGFDPHGILTMQITLPPAKYKRPSQIITFYNDLLRNFQSVPGAEAGAVSTALPVVPTHFTPVLFEGQPAVALGRRTLTNILQISPDYLRVMRIRLVAGRVFNSHDNEKAPPVALVNQNVVRRFWPGQNPLGRKLWVGTLPNAFEVVGVLADTKNNGLLAPTLPEVIMPFPQLTVPYLEVSFRAADPGRLAAVVRQRIALVDGDLPVTEVKTMDDVLESLTTQRRFTLLLFGTFSGLAFLLAMVGLYGIAAYSVARRTEELGIRMALGAARADILGLVVWEGLTLTAAGILVGVIGSLASNRLLRAWLYETSDRDPLTLAASALLFTAVALAASYWPARHATRIDPVAALRAQ